MLLTADQLTSLRIELQSLAGIKYDPVLAELLDHYATLTEQHMDTVMVLYTVSFVQLLDERFDLRTKIA